MMEIVQSALEKKAEFLRVHIKKQIDGFEKRRVENRNQSIRLNLLSIVGGVTVTVLLGIKIAGLESSLSVIALIISGLVTLANTIEGIFGYRRLWIQYTVTTNELRALRDDFEYMLLNNQDELSVEKIDELYGVYSSILKNTNTTWTKVREEYFTPTSQSNQ